MLLEKSRAEHEEEARQKISEEAQKDLQKAEWYEQYTQNLRAEQEEARQRALKLWG